MNSILIVLVQKVSGVITIVSMKVSRSRLPSKTGITKNLGGHYYFSDIHSTQGNSQLLYIAVVFTAVLFYFFASSHIFFVRSSIGDCHHYSCS